MNVVSLIMEPICTPRASVGQGEQKKVEGNTNL